MKNTFSLLLLAGVASVSAQDLSEVKCMMLKDRMDGLLNRAVSVSGTQHRSDKSTTRHDGVQKADPHSDKESPCEYILLEIAQESEKKEPNDDLIDDLATRLTKCEDEYDQAQLDKQIERLRLQAEQEQAERKEQQAADRQRIESLQFHVKFMAEQAKVEANLTEMYAKGNCARHGLGVFEAKINRIIAPLYDMYNSAENSAE